MLVGRQHHSAVAVLLSQQTVRVAVLRERDVDYPPSCAGVAVF
jgi:hypothetical protein